MTIPMWMLLGFAPWTLLLLMAIVGVYRWNYGDDHHVASILSSDMLSANSTELSWLPSRVA